MELWAADAVHQIHGHPELAGKPMDAEDSSRLGPPLRAAWRRRRRLPPLWHFTTDAAEVVAPLSGGWPRRTEDESRRPRRLAKQKVFADQEALVVQLRRSRHLGIKQLRSELLRQHGLGLSLDTLHRILVRHGEQHLKRPKLTRKGKKRYSRPVPGDRVSSTRTGLMPRKPAGSVVAVETPSVTLRTPVCALTAVQRCSL